MISGVSPREERSLARLGVRTSEQLLFWLPRWHVHRDRVTPLADAREGERGFFLARITRTGIFRRGRLHIIKVEMEDGTGRAHLYWFNRPYLASRYKAGRVLVLHETPQRARTGVRFSGGADTVEEVGEDDVRRIEGGETVVFYPTTTVFDQARAREIAHSDLDGRLAKLADPLPEEVRSRFGLPGLAEALRHVHRPAAWEEWEKARRRIVFDQLYFLQLGLGLSRIELSRVRKERSYAREGAKYSKVMAGLPFALTGAQRRVIGEVSYSYCIVN